MNTCTDAYQLPFEWAVAQILEQQTEGCENSTAAIFEDLSDDTEEKSSLKLEPSKDTAANFRQVFPKKLEKINTTACAFRAENECYYSLKVKGDIELKNCKVISKVGTTIGGFSAKHTEIGKLKIKNRAYLAHSNVKLVDCAYEAEFINCTIGKAKSLGKIKAINSTFKQVCVCNNAELINCHAHKVRVKRGKIQANAAPEQPSVFYNLRAKKSIVLSNVHVHHRVTSLTGSITLTNSMVHDSTSCQSKLLLINSSVGAVYISHTFFEPPEVRIALSESTIEGNIYIYCKQERINVHLTGIGTVQGRIKFLNDIECEKQVYQEEGITYNKGKALSSLMYNLA